MSSTHSPLAARSARAFVILLAVALTALLTTLSEAASASSPETTLGVYAGGGNADAVGAFESRLGRDVNQVHDFQPSHSWSALEDIHWPLERWSASRYAHRVTYSIPMLPDTGATLAEGASGAYNAHFRNLALALVANGDGGATLRLGWEFNGDWFKWSIGVPDGAADYAAFWRQIVTTMRAVPGARFTFDWCPTNGSSYVNGRQIDAASAYPGDGYVDYIGLDVYDQSWATNRADQAARWNEYVTQKNGLSWQRAFAAQHGKPISFPEWGIGHRTDGNGGGDSPYFIERMYEWIRTNPVAYHNYFEFADSVLDAALFGGRSPQAAKRFIELFGASATGDRSAAGAGPPPGAGPAAAVATDLRITKARISRRANRVELLSPITRLASGRADVELFAGGRRTTFSATIDSKRGRLLINRSITRRQARRGAGILTIRYRGNAQTLPKEVRLRAAAKAARLRAGRPSMRDDRLVPAGTVAKAARGVVRVELAYNADGRNLTRAFTAKIKNGRWSLRAPLRPRIRAELARRAGAVSAYILYTGYGPASIGGEMTFAKVLGAP